MAVDAISDQEVEDDDIEQAREQARRVGVATSSPIQVNRQSVGDESGHPDQWQNDPVAAEVVKEKLAATARRLLGFTWPAHSLNIRCGEAVHAEGVGDLAAVMEVMLEDVPDDPSAGDGVYLAVRLILDSRLQIRQCIASQHLLQDLPGLLQSAYQFTCRARWATRFSPHLKSAEIIIALSQAIVEPPGPHPNHVTRQLIDRTQVRRGAERKLLR